MIIFGAEGARYGFYREINKTILAIASAQRLDLILLFDRVIKGLEDVGLKRRSDSGMLHSDRNIGTCDFLNILLLSALQRHRLSN
jgi:hypothetical protein